MSAALHTQPEPVDPFGSSRGLFESLVADAKSARMLTIGHADVEAAILTAGQELMRQLYQDHLDFRHSRERRVEVVADDGVRRSERRVLHRTLRSRLGDVVVSRFLYQESGHEGRAPADAALRLCEDGFSMGLRKEVARLCASDAYEPAMETLERLTRVHVAHRQAEQLTRRAANDVISFYAEQPPEAESTDDLLILSFDAAGIVMRRDSLRPSTRKKAESEPEGPAFPPKLKSGKKSNRKRMAQVGVVYTVSTYMRTADDILGELQSLTSTPRDEGQQRPPRPRPVNKRLYASVSRAASEVVDDGFRDALSRDPKRQRRWVVLVDGNPDQLAAVRRAAKRLGVEITIVADLIHLIEYLWPAAYCFHEAGSDEARAWVLERVRALLEGANPSDVAAGMRRSATRRHLEKRQAVDACAHYMLGLAPHMRYGEALRDGLPIATGVIEGACRHLVRRRLDIGGARWSTEGAEAVLMLRAVVLSGDFDRYWAFHDEKVFQHTHAVKYQGPIPFPHASRSALRRVK